MPDSSSPRADTSATACAPEFLAELARDVLRRCDEGAFSDDPAGITRTFCSPAMTRLHAAMRGWMEAAGMTCRLDAATNLIGRFDLENNPDRPALLVGSHLDTVPNGGRYDGMLGVLLGVALVEALSRSGARLPFALEVVAFSEEEGVRYGAPFIGSKALAGCSEASLLERVDAQGITAGDALRGFGGRPEAIDTAAADPSRVLAFVEAHIEQGPLLQQNDLPLGVVTAIAGATRAAIRFTGAAGHAGTVPMQLRRDALTAAAAWILDVERAGRETPGLVATVGVVEVLPNAGNVIPGEVRLRLDIRHADDRVRLAAIDELCRRGRELAEGRNVAFEFTEIHAQGAVALDDAMLAHLEHGLVAAGVQPTRLVSGAGHDAGVMASRFPTAMLFVRCRDGISHHPDESVELADVTCALTALWHFVERLAVRENLAPAANHQGN